jgi:hypothetical protein
LYPRFLKNANKKRKLRLSAWIIADLSQDSFAKKYRRAAGDQQGLFSKQTL